MKLFQRCEWSNPYSHLPSYQEACQRAGVIDFTDLLLKTCKLLQSKPELRAHYQNSFPLYLGG